MIEFTIKRTTQDGRSTEGELHFPSFGADKTWPDFDCFTLELPWQDNQPLISSIPAGRYKVIIDFSNRFQRQMPLLLDVPGRTGIRIHKGNAPSNTEGCILLGTSEDLDWVGGSGVAFDQFFAQLGAATAQDDVWVSITDP
jgi:hypothetical protein